MAEVEQAQACPVCGTLTEPELDGDHKYFECESDECVGFAWGFTRISDADPDCAIGVPEDVRRLASGFDPPVERSTSVNLGATIPLRPGA